MKHINGQWFYKCKAYPTLLDALMSAWPKKQLGIPPVAS